MKGFALGLTLKQKQKEVGTGPIRVLRFKAITCTAGIQTWIPKRKHFSPFAVSHYQSLYIHVPSTSSGLLGIQSLDFNTSMYLFKILVTHSQRLKMNTEENWKLLNHTLVVRCHLFTVSGCFWSRSRVFYSDFLPPRKREERTTNN